MYRRPLRKNRWKQKRKISGPWICKTNMLVMAACWQLTGLNFILFPLSRHFWLFLFIHSAQADCALGDLQELQYRLTGSWVAVLRSRTGPEPSFLGWSRSHLSSLWFLNTTTNLFMKAIFTKILELKVWVRKKLRSYCTVYNIFILCCWRWHSQDIFTVLSKIHINIINF